MNGCYWHPDREAVEGVGLSANCVICAQRPPSGLQFAWPMVWTPKPRTDAELKAIEIAEETEYLETRRRDEGSQP